MTETIYWANLTKLGATIKALPQADNTLAMLEMLPARYIEPDELNSGLCFIEFDVEQSFDCWGRGRIFNPKGELRWETLGDEIQAVYVGGACDLPGFTQAEELNLAEATQKTSTYYLWGRRLSAKQLQAINQPEDELLFVELQVPRLLDYPISADQVADEDRIKLSVVEYYHPKRGDLLYYRFQGVESA